MQWVWEPLRFRKAAFRVAHFEAPGSTDPDIVDDSLTEHLERCEEELGACLWHETNDFLLRFLERRRADYRDQRVLELGAGVGVIAIALALDGANALATDLPALLPVLELNVDENFGSRELAEPIKVELDIAQARKPKKKEKKPNARVRAEKVVPGTCRAAAVDWLQEARHPTLPAAAFDVIVVCDSLYENKTSWDSLRQVLEATVADDAQVVLASAALRRPFLEEFCIQLQAVGFQILDKEDNPRVCVVVLRPAERPPALDAAQTSQGLSCQPSEPLESIEPQPIEPIEPIEPSVLETSGS